MAKKSAESKYTPRERMIYSTVQLVRQSGMARTGLRDVVAHAEAPWGSLQYYFPGGKDQIVGEAIDWAARYTSSRVEQYMTTAKSPTPSGLFSMMVDQWRTELTSRGYERGCMLVAVAAEVVGEESELRDAVESAFTAWQTPVVAALRTMGVPKARAASLATLMISSLEGALIMARTRRDVTPLTTVVRELKPLLDGAVPAR